MIIDAHCHVWPDHLAQQVLRQRPAGLDPVHDGTIDGLKATMDRAGIDLAICLAVANSARTLHRTNEYIGSIDRSRFIPFGTVHPDLPVETNIASLRDNGIAGVKLHPVFQQLSLIAADVLEILQALAAEGIPVITHVGGGGDEAATERGSTRNLLLAAEKVPGLTLIACHFGGYLDLDQAERLAVGSPIILETSWPPSLDELGTERVRALVERHGADRVVFGSDWPMADPARELAAVRALGLPADQEQAVLGGTLAGLLGLGQASPSIAPVKE
jgi:predicted TIM-barrel fold metal-dependent hydrolase